VRYKTCIITGIDVDLTIQLFIHRSCYHTPTS
jgi:hypothetical protein